jgi:adenosylcobinamide-phosphate synthase
MSAAPLRLQALGAAAGLVADRLLGEPPVPGRLHPVALYGRAVLRLEQDLYADDRRHGAAYAAVGSVAAALTGRALGRLGTFPSTAAATYVSAAGRALHAAAADVGRALERDNLVEARELLPSLVGRDPTRLDAAAIARAVVESVAENTSDAVVAPLLWGALAGPPGIAGYRAVNTLDAMVGYRTSRYHRFGWAAAKLDDAANWLPARLTATLACGLAPLVGGSPRQAGACWHRYGAAHPSPNAGRVEAAFAGALRVRLGGGDNRYGDHTDPRPVLGDGRQPIVTDIHRAVRLATAVGSAAAVLAAGVAAVNPALAGSRSRVPAGDQPERWGRR